MVFTRGQKRKFEEGLDSNILNDISLSSSNEDFNKRQDNYIDSVTKPLTITIKRKKTSNTQTEKKIETSVESDLETSDESDIKTSDESDTKTSDESENETSVKTLPSNDIVGKCTTAQKLETVIKTSLANLVSKFTKNEKTLDEPKDEYDKYLNYVDTIYDGDFFESESIDDKKKKLKNLFSENDIKKLNIELQEIKSVYNKRVPNIVNILKMDMHISQKQKLLEKMYHFVNSDILSADYNSNLKYLISNINSDDNLELVELEKRILEKSNSIEYSDNYRQKILKSKMPFENKIIAYKRLEIMESFESTDTSEYAKYKSWMDILLSIPYEKPINNKICQEDSKMFIKCVRDTLDARLSFLETAKDQVLNIVTQMVRNPDNNCLPAIGLYGEKGVGKCLGFNTPILMYDGSIKMVQDIKIGDVLMGDDSNPRNVLSLARGKEEMFEISHTLHNESYIVNKSHILTLKMSNNKKLNDRKDRNSFVVKWFDCKDIKLKSKHFNYSKSKKQDVYTIAKIFFENINEDKIVDIPLTDYLKLKKQIQSHLQGFKVGVEFPEQELDFDPYIIGLWLGDGSSSQSAITNQDSTIIYYLANTLPKYKLHLTKLKDVYSYGICGSKKVGENIFLNTLKNLNLINNKHIPSIYKINSRENRLKLLAGIIDSDGSLFNSKSGYDIIQKNPQLSKDIVYLARSLGFQCKPKMCKKGCYYKGQYKEGEYTRMSIYGNGIEEIPVLCPRKKANSRRQIKDPLVTAINITPKGVNDYYGFVIDGNHRFMLGNFIVTHNTAFVKSISEALGRPYRTISLGGESDSSSLTGHGFTYVGSGPGRIIEILRETQCTNPIILFDELDKVSETYRGKEIIGNLIHLTDSTSNDKYNYDKYFAGLEFDLSKVLFIFTYNDETKVDPILADRLFKIRVNNYSVTEKLEIAKTHLIKTILSQYNYEIEFEDDAIRYIVETSRSDQGMRDVKRKFEVIISRVNTLLLTDPQQDIIRLKYKILYNYYKSTSDKILILKDHVDIFLTDSIIKNVDNGPPPGMYM